MNKQNVPLADLKRVRQWSQDKIQAGSEPPWAWYQHMKLVDAVNAILEGIAATTEHSQQSAPHSGRHLQLVGAKSQQDSVPRHPAAKKKISLPM